MRGALFGHFSEVAFAAQAQLSISELLCGMLPRLHAWATCCAGPLDPHFARMPQSAALASAVSVHALTVLHQTLHWSMERIRLAAEARLAP